jgi:hypothetical protein
MILDSQKSHALTREIKGLKVGGALQTKAHFCSHEEISLNSITYASRGDHWEGVHLARFLHTHQVFHKRTCPVSSFSSFVMFTTQAHL